MPEGRELRDGCFLDENLLPSLCDDACSSGTNENWVCAAVLGLAIERLCLYSSHGSLLNAGGASSTVPLESRKIDRRLLAIEDRMPGKSMIGGLDGAGFCAAAGSSIISPTDSLSLPPSGSNGREIFPFDTESQLVLRLRFLQIKQLAKTSKRHTTAMGTTMAAASRDWRLCGSCPLSEGWDEEEDVELEAAGSLLTLLLFGASVERLFEVWDALWIRRVRGSDWLVSPCVAVTLRTIAWGFRSVGTRPLNSCLGSSHRSHGEAGRRSTESLVPRLAVPFLWNT